MPNNAKVGGVLCIVAGSFGVLGMMFSLLMAAIFIFVPGTLDNSRYYYDYSPDNMAVFVGIYFLILGVIWALAGALAITGGIFALRRKHWGLALAGSICATLTFFPCGIPAIIFTAMGKPEFQGGTAPPAAPAAPMQKIVG